MKIVELQPDKALLKTNFDGYKLSLDPIPILRLELTELSKPDRVQLGKDQYSLLHAQLFNLHNHLVRDPWQSGCCYYIDADWTIRRIQYDEVSGKLKPLCAVFKMTKTHIRAEGDCNSSLILLSEKYGIISDGQGMIRLVDTGDRYRKDEWKEKFCFPEIEGFTKQVVLKDGRFEIINEERQIHILCTNVQQKESGFNTILYWMKAVQLSPNGEWRYHSFDTLSGKGYPFYCNLEPKSGAIIISSNQRFKFVGDLSNTLETNETKHLEVDRLEQLPVECGKMVNLYWTQTEENISMRILIEIR